MAQLSIFDAQTKELIKESTNPIKDLASIGIQLEYWDRPEDFNSEDSEQSILDTFSEQIERIKQNYNFAAVDIVALKPNQLEDSKQDEMRQKFLAEHTHSDDELRYFIEGQGLFTIHHEDKVYMTLCTAGDFIAVPAMTKHWFDFGTKPNFKCLRFFTNEDGWVADYTGDEIAKGFPKL